MKGDLWAEEHLWTEDSVGIMSEVLSWQEWGCVCLVQLCVKYRLVSTTSSPLVSRGRRS